MKIERLGADFATEAAAVHASAMTNPWSGGEFRRLLENGARMLGAREGGALAGVALVSIAADEAEILTLAARPEFHRRGVGLALMGEAIEEARVFGARALFLEAAEDNAAALALYRKLGFSEIGRRRRYYAGGVDALAMRLTL